MVDTVACGDGLVVVEESVWVWVEVVAEEDGTILGGNGVDVGDTVWNWVEVVVDVLVEGIVVDLDVVDMGDCNWVAFGGDELLEVELSAFRVLSDEERVVGSMGVSELLVS